MLAKCQASGACHNWEKEKEENDTMKDKTEIVDNWLPRYTGVPLDQFGEHILLTNFGGYLHAYTP